MHGYTDGRVVESGVHLNVSEWMWLGIEPRPLDHFSGLPENSSVNTYVETPKEFLNDDWRWQGNCKYDVALFFPIEGESLEDREAREDQAVMLCGRCTVREQCQNYAVQTRQKEGVWAGFKQAELATIIKHS